MYISKSSALYLLTAAASGVQAFSFNDAVSSLKRDVSLPDMSSLKRSVLDVFKRDSCPSVWTDVASELKGLFLGGDGLCTDDARAAIRLSFHDCFSGAGCDGSIILAQEYTRTENSGLAGIAVKIGDLATKYNVGTADMIQFAGASATATCPLGPRIRVLVGRQDSSEASPEGQLPSPFADASTLISQFAAKGFSAVDLAALIGAHSTAKQFNAIPDKSGESLDSTPGTWDVKYYSETLDGTAPVSLDSDVNLANDVRTKGSFAAFSVGQAAWGAAYVSAMNRMTVIGNDVGSLTDCTGVVTAGTSKRDIRAAPIAGRL